MEIVLLPFLEAFLETENIEGRTLGSYHIRRQTFKSRDVRYYRPWTRMPELRRMFAFSELVLTHTGPDGQQRDYLVVDLEATERDDDTQRSPLWAYMGRLSLNPLWDPFLVVELYLR